MTARDLRRFRFFVATLAIPTCIWMSAELGGETGFAVGVILFAAVLIVWAAAEKAFFYRDVPPPPPPVPPRPVFTGPAPVVTSSHVSRPVACDTPRVAKIRRIAEDTRAPMGERAEAYRQLRKLGALHGPALPIETVEG